MIYLEKGALFDKVCKVCYIDKCVIGVKLSDFRKMVGQSKMKRRKLECSVCGMTFDSDFRNKHNQKYHQDFLSSHQHIPFKVFGSPENPFIASKKKTMERMTENLQAGQEASETENQSTNYGEIRPMSITRPSTSSDGPTEVTFATDNSSEPPNINTLQSTESKEQAVGENTHALEEIPDEQIHSGWIKSFGNFPSDPGNLRGILINAQLRTDLVKCGPCQPKDIEFPKGSSGRCCIPSWYTKNKEPRDWLVYSVKENAMFCFCCWLFTAKSDNAYEGNWCDEGITNFKKGTEKIKKHECTKLHCISLARWKSFERRLLRGKTIDAHLQEQLAQEKEEQLRVLDRVFSASLFLALQGLPFRSHRLESQEELSESCGNSGNYLELLKLLSKFDPIMAHSLGNKQSSIKYTSPKIQNEIINSIATKVRETIICEIKDAKFFCFILDTTPDISHIEQLAFSVRYVKN